jgi:tetratricopeptide (TPR) repeat protein
MPKRFVWLSLAAVILSFIGGFFLANSMNRREMDSLRTENESLKAAPAPDSAPDGSADLSNEEIRAKIAEADRNSSNFQFQKNLGLALYRYATLKKDTDLLAESARLLERAAALDPKDFDVLVGAGNANFDRAYFTKQHEPYSAARNYYEKALQVKPGSSEVIADVGLTYFLQEPPDDPQAVIELEKSLKADPKNEKALEFIIQALNRQGRADEAKQYLERLKQVNPQNETISGLSAQTGTNQAAQPK